MIEEGKQVGRKVQTPEVGKPHLKPKGQRPKGVQMSECKHCRGDVSQDLIGCAICEMRYEEIQDLQAEVERLREAIEIHKEEAEASMPNQKLWDKADRQEGEGE